MAGNAAMKVAITGAGASVPPLIMTNERLLGMFPGPRKMPWTPEEFEKKTGIRERRFSFDFDDAAGRPVFPPGYGDAPGPAGLLAEEALRESLLVAGLDARDLDGLVVGCSTPDRLGFGGDAQLLHHRVGMRPDAAVLQVDVGCGGSVFCLQWAKEMILSGVRKKVAVVMVQLVSPLLSRDLYTGSVAYAGKENEAFLTALLFGDGAGAVILQAVDDDSESRIESSATINEYHEIVVRPAGGNLRPPGMPGIDPSDHAHYVIGRRVADAYAPTMKKMIDHVLADARMDVGDIERFYPHQSNLRLIEKLMDIGGLPEDRTAINVERYGNTSGASVFILLAEDIRNQKVTLGSGDPVVIAAIGANLQYGAHVVRL
ncbi:3-oxoacyl-[acyl-carrier-protein] synthase III C-terminal domain-containing protein [Nocardia sp. NPDC049707]|uniref:3-oxoacyl-ACP synthase III family protein n=1 Tax=Nocardia sp. NPDC049707 TaxID=3154735 RepID=UPI00342B835D